MAVTQQLGRIGQEALARCRVDDEFLHRVLDTWDVMGQADVLDLDWSPRALLRLFDLAGADATALWRALHGDELVNPDYETFISQQAAVTMLSPAGVREVDVALRDAGVAQVAWDSLAIDEAAARVALGLTDFVGDRREYIDGHLAALRRFYTEAAQRGLAVIQWWD